MAAVDCMPMASRHHPHHPYNQHVTIDCSSSAGSNNPYARYMSPVSSIYSRNSRNSRNSFSEYSTSSTPSIWWAGPEHHPLEPKRRRDSHSSQLPKRSRSQRYPRNSLLVNPDIIDELDNATLYSYHHEGPYDAVCPERNRLSQHSPLEAVRESNEEALRATPQHKIMDSINSHRPLDGVAFYPPGTTDRMGQSYDYEEGSNMMNDYGNFMRLPGKVSLYSA